MVYKYVIRTRKSEAHAWRTVESYVFDSFDKKWAAYDHMTGNRWNGDDFDYEGKQLLCSDDGGTTWRAMTDDEEFMFYGKSRSRPHGGYF